jgi:hypothetical protein
MSEVNMDIGRKLTKLPKVFLPCGHPRDCLTKGNLQRTDDGDCTVCLLHDEIQSLTRERDEARNLIREFLSLLDLRDGSYLFVDACHTRKCPGWHTRTSYKPCTCGAIEKRAVWKTLLHSMRGEP